MGGLKKQLKNLIGTAVLLDHGRENMGCCNAACTSVKLVMQS